MFSTVLEDAMFEVRRRWKTRVFVPLAIVAVFLIIGVVVTLVAWLSANRAQPPAVNSEDIPLGSYAAGNIEVFDCIYRGPDDCDNYAKSKEWASGATTGELTYTPFGSDKNAPGEKAEGKTRRVTDFKSLSDKQWRALAAGVTNGGEANPGTVTENSVKTSSFTPEDVSATATFSLTKENALTTGTMTFTLTDSGVVLKSVSYSKEG